MGKCLAEYFLGAKTNSELFVSSFYTVGDELRILLIAQLVKANLL